MLTNLVRFFWGDLTSDEMKKFGILSAIFFLIIGAYWTLRVMKDAQFAMLVGYKYQPYAKMVSLVFVICAVLFYNKLISILKRKTLFYSLTTFYGITFLIIAYFIAQQTGSGAATTIASPSALSGMFSFIPGKFLGWFTYCFLESFGSIIVALFWSFVASTTTTDSAKRGYGMVVASGQVGLLIGTLVVAKYVKAIGIGTLFGIGGLLICLIPFFVKLYVSSVPMQTEQEAQATNKPKTGMLEGLRLIISKPYIAGLLVVTTMYEIINTIVEFQMGMCIDRIYPASLDAGAAFAWFKAWNGFSVGVLSLTFALLGTSFFMRKFGLRFCLIAFPTTIGITIATLFAFYITGASNFILMWAFFVAVVIFKGLSYTLNNPTKEVMYIPTSKDVKFKAKSWIDAFGNRTAKGAGAVVTGSLGAALPTLLMFGTGISLTIVIFWLFIASKVGNQFNRLQAENKIIE